MIGSEDDFDLGRVTDLIDMGDVHGARDRLLQRLSTAPDDPEAHATLGLILLEEKRVAAAEHEARLALSLDPTCFTGFGVLALALIGRRQLDEAAETLDRGLAIHPDADWYHLLHARIHDLRGDRDASLAACRRALELEPADPDNHAAVGWCHQERGDLDAAARHALDALELHPGNVSALCLMGHVLLERGELDDARQHALWALRSDPTSERALRLMAAYKARKQVLLGLWWRFMVWLNRGGERGIVLVLLGAWLLQAVATIETEHAGLDTLSSAISIGWLVVVAASWFAPTLFARALARELEPVNLGDDF